MDDLFKLVSIPHLQYFGGHKLLEAHAHAPTDDPSPFQHLVCLEDTHFRAVSQAGAGAPRTRSYVHLCPTRALYAIPRYEAFHLALQNENDGET